MKVKFSLIPFIPAALAMIFFRVMSIFGADGSGHFMGMDKMAVSYTAIGIAAALFVVCIVINILDKKTSPVYPVKKNLAAGIACAVSGALVISSSVANFMNSTTDSEYYVMTLICAIASIPAAIAFFLMTRTHIQGKSIVSSISTLFVFPAIWGCTEIVYEFLEATKVSISATDMTPLFCFIFLTLYYFSHAMVISRVKGRNPVKACFIYGLPAVALSLSYSFYRLFTGIQEGGGYASVLNAAMFFVLAVYAILFITEMARHSLTKDEIKVIDGLPGADEIEEEEKKYINTEGYDDLVFSENTIDSDAEGDAVAESDTEAGDIAGETADNRPSDYFQNAKGLDDFIIGYQAPQDDEPVPYLTQSEMKKSTENSFVVGYGDNTEEEVKTGSSDEVKPEPVAEVKSEPAAEEKTEPAAEVKPEPVAEAKAALAARRNPVPAERRNPAPAARRNPAPAARRNPNPGANQNPANPARRNPNPANPARRVPNPGMKQNPVNAVRRNPAPAVQQKPAPARNDSQNDVADLLKELDSKI